MNDEQDHRYADEADAPRPRSRWAVSPGSIDDPFSSRQSARHDDEERPGRRRASEIIDEAKKRPSYDGSPTRVSARRPSVPDAPHTSHHRADDDDDDDGTPVVRRSPRAPLYDESARVTPDLGEKRELRAATAAPSGRLVMAGFGGVIMIAIGALIGAIIDFLFTDRLGIITAVGLALGAALAALVTRKRDLLSIIVAPPLVYAVVAAVVLLLASKPIRVTGVADAAIRGFPAMAIATGIAALIAGVRLLTSKSGERR